MGGGGCGGGGLLDNAYRKGSATSFCGHDCLPHAPPSKVEDLICSLHNGRKAKNLDHALHLLACIRESGLEAHPSLGNLLVSLLVDVGSMCHAQQVFDKLVCLDVCSWNALITGYVKHGEPQHALTLYNKMRQNILMQPNGYTYVALLKACAMLRDLERGHEVHIEIATRGLLETNVFVGSSLIDMYSKCGSLTKAQEVFDKLLEKNVVCWNALVTGYVEHGHADKALDYLKQMHFCGIPPNTVTFLCGLKVCGSIGIMGEACELHVDIARRGLETDLVVGSSLVDMYAKCACIAHAQNVFDKLLVRNVVSWTALIAGYAEHGCDEKALHCFELMKSDGVSPGIPTFVCSLKACSNLGSLSNGQKIYAQIVGQGLEGDPMIGSALIDMYAKCGLLAIAHEVFDKLLVKDVISCTVLMARYVDHRFSEEALVFYEQMQQDGTAPSIITFICGLNACGNIQASNKGQEIHADIVKRGLLEWDITVGSSLVEMYAKSGLLAEAQEVFDQLPLRFLAAWNAVITAYAEHELGVEALNCFQQMQHEGMSPDAISFVCSLKACSSIEKGQEIFVEIAKRGLEMDPVVGSKLISMFAKCGNVFEMEEIFERLLTNDVVVWTAIIAGYAEHGQGDKVLSCFDQMHNEGVTPDAATFVCILKACGHVGDATKRHEIHGKIIRKGLDRELHIGNALIDMYARSGYFVEAQQVLHKLPAQTAITWTALIAGYNEHGYKNEALYYLEQMQLEGICLDVVTIDCSLKICGSMKEIGKGRELHAELVKKGLAGKDNFTGRTLVDMYANLGLLEEAHEEFGKLQVRDTVPWTALVAGYADHGLVEKALFCFDQMQIDGFSPSAATVVCVLKACGSLRAVDRGREMHALIVKKGLDENIVLASSLIDMYSKCGSLIMAQEVFNIILDRDVILWNALMSGYAQLGDCTSVFHTFDTMVEGGGKPDDVTFLIVFNACSHAGLIDEGQLYFGASSSSYGCIPTLEHYNCMVDLLGRAGLVDEAIVIIKTMPLHPGITLWHTVLSSCRKWGNVEIGRDAFEHVVALREEDAASYVCMSNIYVDVAIMEDSWNKIDVVNG